MHESSIVKKKPVNENRNTKLKTNTYVTNIVEHQEILEEIRSGNKYFWFKKKKAIPKATVSNFYGNKNFLKDISHLWFFIYSVYTIMDVLSSYANKF